LFKQEKIAKSLYSELTNYISEKKINAKSELEGAGVHWNCISKSENASVSIYSCDVSYMANNKGFNEEFIVSFFSENDEICCGRSYNRENVIKSVENWLLNKEKAELYTSFHFVDKGLRMINDLEGNWLTKQPNLKSTNRIIENHGSGIIRFEIKKDNRACWFTTTGETDELSISFSIDECLLFESVADNYQIAEVLNRYLITKETISNLSKEFNWIVLNDLVKAYENGNGIEGEFINSWENISKFYQEINEEFKSDVLSFISDLRSKGFDKTLRAGQSLYTFILSKSRRHGLTENQQYLAFSFGRNKMIIRNNKNEEIHFTKIELNSEIEKLLNSLNKQQIE